MDEVTAWFTTEFEPESVIYNNEDYNRNIYWSAHHWWTLPVWSLLVDWWTFFSKMADLHDSHVLSTHFMKSDWLKMKYPDVGMKCKQGHVVKCSVDHQKMLSQSSLKNKPTWVLMQHACIVGHVTKILCIKTDSNGRLTHNWVDHHAGNRETTRYWYIQSIVSIKWFVSKLASWAWS